MNEQRKIDEKRKVNEEIRILTRYNEVDNATIGRFRTMSKNDSFVQTQLTKLEKQIAERTTKIEEMNDRLTKLEAGELDDEIEADLKRISFEISEKSKATTLKKKLEAELKNQDKKMSKEYNDQERKNDKMDKQWYYKSAHKHFEHANDSLPEYITRDLNKMPCNTGYSWKGVYFFGKRPENSNVYTVTENRKGMKIIYRWSKDFNNVYHKEGKNDEVLISSAPRRKVETKNQSIEV